MFDPNLTNDETKKLILETRQPLPMDYAGMPVMCWCWDSTCDYAPRLAPVLASIGSHDNTVRILAVELLDACGEVSLYGSHFDKAYIATKEDCSESEYMGKWRHNASKYLVSIYADQVTQIIEEYDNRKETK